MDPIKTQLTEQARQIWLFQSQLWQPASGGVIKAEASQTPWLREKPLKHPVQAPVAASYELQRSLTEAHFPLMSKKRQLAQARHLLLFQSQVWHPASVGWAVLEGETMQDPEDRS